MGSYAEVERLNGIVDSYLRFARDEPPALVDCDLAKVLERATRMVGEQVAAQDVTVATVGLDEPQAVTVTTVAARSRRPRASWEWVCRVGASCGTWRDAAPGPDVRTRARRPPPGGPTGRG